MFIALFLLVADTPFVDRPFFVAGDIGFDSGFGVRFGGAPLPEIQLEAHAGTFFLLLNTLGGDIRLLPLAKTHGVTPTIRIGAAATFVPIFAVASLTPMIVAAVGVAWRMYNGFVLQADAGALALFPSGVIWAPTGVLSLGYAFKK